MDPGTPRPHLRTPERWTAGVYANGMKIPPRLAFEVLKQLNAGLGRYEAAHGKIPDFQSPS